MIGTCWDRSPSLASTARAGLDPASEPEDPWRFANERARWGVARLRTKEDEIVSHKPVQTGANSRDELALDREKAA